MEVVSSIEEVIVVSLLEEGTFVTVVVGLASADCEGCVEGVVTDGWLVFVDEPLVDVVVDVLPLEDVVVVTLLKDVVVKGFVVCGGSVKCIPPLSPQFF